LLGAVLGLGLLLAGKPAQAQITIQPSPNGEVALVVNFEVKAGTEAEFEQFFRRSVMCSRLEPANIAFNVHRVMGSERSYVLYEIWRSEEALNSHLARPYTKALFATFDRNLTRPVTAGGLHFVADLDPQSRSAPAATDPAARAECR
jgi:quinol monooxygenase YgiN